MKKFLFPILACLPSLLWSQSKEELIRQIQSAPQDINSVRLITQVDANNPNHKELRALYKTLDKKVKKTNDAKFLDRYIKAVESTSPGKKAPGITQFDISGEPYSLQDLKGKYVLVSFWASWNTMSRQEIPLFQEIHQMYKDKNFEILGVSFDNDFKTWKKYIDDNKLGWKHISDLQNMNNAASQTYGVRAIPQNVLVDPNGIIVARNLKDLALKNKLAELLK